MHTRVMFQSALAVGALELGFCGRGGHLVPPSLVSPVTVLYSMTEMSTAYPQRIVKFCVLHHRRAGARDLTVRVLSLEATSRSV